MRVIGERSENIDIDEVLSRPLFADLPTASDTSPRNSPVWFLWEEEALWIIANHRENIFHLRLDRQPRCSVGIVSFDRGRGIVEHVGFRGRATIEPFDRYKARRLLVKYLREKLWDARFKESLDDPDNVFVRSDPETAVARDQSYSTNG